MTTVSKIRIAACLVVAPWILLALEARAAPIRYEGSWTASVTVVHDTCSDTLANQTHQLDITRSRRLVRIDWMPIFFRPVAVRTLIRASGYVGDRGMTASSESICRSIAGAPCAADSFSTTESFTVYFENPSGTVRPRRSNAVIIYQKRNDDGTSMCTSIFTGRALKARRVARTSSRS